MSEPASTKNKDCHCTAAKVVAGTKKCKHGWDFPGAVTHADKLRSAIEKLHKFSRSPKAKELLDAMLDDVEGVEMDAQECYDEWQSECEARVEDQKEAEEQQARDDERIEQLEEQLRLALSDRTALLDRIGLTDLQWAMSGGIPAAHMGA